MFQAYIYGSDLAVYLKMSTTFGVIYRRSFKMSFDFRSFVSLDALVTLLADRGLVGDVGGVLVGIDLVRLGSLIDTGIARNNLKSNVNKFVMENEPSGSNTNMHKNKV